MIDAGSLSEKERYAANYLMSHAFIDWAEHGDQADYIDLARRLNAAAVTALRIRKEERNDVA